MQRELKTLIKDTVRGARFAVRHVAGGPVSAAIPGGQRLYHLADDILTTAEGAVTKLRPGDGAGLSVQDALDAIVTLSTSSRSGSFEDGFRVSCYALYKAALDSYGVRNFYLAERSFQKAARLVQADHDGDAGFAAAATLALIAQSPLRMADVPDGVADEIPAEGLSQALAFVVGLTMTAYAAKRGSVDGAQCLASAGDMVAAIRDRLDAAAASPEPRTALRIIYQEIGALLP